MGSGGGELGSRWRCGCGVASSGNEKPGEGCACASMLGGVGNILLSSSARTQRPPQRASSHRPASPAPPASAYVTHTTFIVVSNT